jgi:hypothetical protein
VLLAVCCLAVTNSGCAVLLSGRNQDVLVRVQPPGARVEVYEWDGTLVASTAATSQTVLRVRRPPHGRSYLIRASKEGYCPQYWLTKTELTGPGAVDAAFSIVLFVATTPIGFLIFTGLEDATGAPYAINPSTIVTSLGSEGSCAR